MHYRDIHDTVVSHFPECSFPGNLDACENNGGAEINIKVWFEWGFVSLEMITLVTWLQFQSNLCIREDKSMQRDWNGLDKFWLRQWRSSTRRENVSFKEIKKCWRSHTGDRMVTFSCGLPHTRIRTVWGNKLSLSLFIKHNFESKYKLCNKGSGHKHTNKETHKTQWVTVCYYFVMITFLFLEILLKMRSFQRIWKIIKRTILLVKQIGQSSRIIWTVQCQHFKVIKRRDL